MENPVLLPGQQLAVAARRLPDPRRAVKRTVVVAAPYVEHQDRRVFNGVVQQPATENVEFELDELSLGGDKPIPVWRFDGKLFVDHWVDFEDTNKLRLFIELASKATAVEIHEREGELVRVSAYFCKRPTISEIR
jgi:hypothetical protein